MTDEKETLASQILHSLTFSDATEAYRQNTIEAEEILEFWDFGIAKYAVLLKLQGSTRWAILSTGKRDNPTPWVGKNKGRAARQIAYLKERAKQPTGPRYRHGNR